MVPRVFDRLTVRAHRDRAARAEGSSAWELIDMLAERLVERLDAVRQPFARALDWGGRGAIAPRLAVRGIEVIAGDLSAPLLRRSAPAASALVAADDEALPFRPGSFDLAVAHLSLHTTNDLPGALIQFRQALRPGGLFLASLPVLGTLDELRIALLDAEEELTGRVSPRVSPFPDLADCAGLLQRAGFALPVADAEAVSLAYADPFALLTELRDAGETLALAERPRGIPPRALFPAALARLPERDGRRRLTLRFAVLTGWAPS